MKDKQVYTKNFSYMIGGVTGGVKDGKYVCEPCKTTGEQIAIYLKKNPDVMLIDTIDTTDRKCINVVSVKAFFQGKQDYHIKEAAPELLEACQNAIMLVDLWAPSYSDENIKESEIGELAALSLMRQQFEKAISKALGQ